MATIVTRSGKGSPLTHTEVDANFTNLNSDKLESSSYTASDVLTKIKTVDGTGSGLDADTLDGNEATAFATSSQGSNADTAYGWGDHASAGYATYPSQTGNSGKYLTTDGSVTSWATVDALPDQTGNSGKYLTTDGSAASWAVLDTDANTTTKGLYEMANTITANYSITSGNNALSAGPVTINSGVSVTVPTGSTWVIA